MADGSESKDGNTIETFVGLCVVILATFLGVVNVKDGNIVQLMQKKQVDRANNWAWFQARNIRGTVYEGFAEELKVPWPNETPEIAKVREAKSEWFRNEAKKQEEKSKKQKDDAEQAEKDYDSLNAKDDQFDLCEAALAIGLALMGVTALVKRWWLFAAALVPSVFGVVMGVAGFLGFDTNTGWIKTMIEVLS